MGTFERKNRSDFRQIVAKTVVFGSYRRGADALTPQYQAFLIFAYLRTTEQSHENIAFSVLKSAPPDSGSRRRGRPPRRDAIHRVSPARGKAPLRHSSPAVAIRDVQYAMNRVSTREKCKTYPYKTARQAESVKHTLSFLQILRVCAGIICIFAENTLLWKSSNVLCT